MERFQRMLEIGEVRMRLIAGIVSVADSAVHRIGRMDALVLIELHFHQILLRLLNDGFVGGVMRLHQRNDRKAGVVVRQRKGRTQDVAVDRAVGLWPSVSGTGVLWRPPDRPSSVRPFLKSAEQRQR